MERNGIGIAVCLLLICGLMIWSFCYVVTNALRYLRLVRLMVKEEYINW